MKGEMEKEKVLGVLLRSAQMVYGFAVCVLIFLQW